MEVTYLSSYLAIWVKSYLTILLNQSIYLSKTLYRELGLHIYYPWNIFYLTRKIHQVLSSPHIDA